jgi:4-diphosphocytidyl-2-C-methyl-D-erythritol kinase
MTPIALPQLEGKWIVLIKPDEGVSTREAYAGVKPAVPELSLTERLKAPISEWQQSIKNDFERSVFAAHPVIGEFKQLLLDRGALYAAMSGSGSTVFGIFESREAAEKLSDTTPYIYKM